MAPVSRNLLIACIAGFLLQMWGGIDLRPFALWPQNDWNDRFEPWQVVTYAFLHGDLIHLFFNMFALYMFGTEIERLFGARRFPGYYFACVLTAALTQLLVQQVMDLPSRSTVGASGGIFGLLLAYGVSYPHRKLMLIFPPIPMPAWLFVTLYGVAELFMGLYGRNSNIAHFAHLGGMAGGLVLLLWWCAQRRAPRH